jgi:hypothetical protein
LILITGIIWLSCGKSGNMLHIFPSGAMNYVTYFTPGRSSGNSLVRVSIENSEN